MCEKNNQVSDQIICYSTVMLVSYGMQDSYSLISN